ncbi:DNA polymerase III subunit delta' [Bacillus alveayuensis]|jgi:DNA polymerase III subunit delta'|uniref:DNA polymerase III subunit delta' n=1 Tax=Aeribacillus alveayuensis TaxID=279215 RepID=A0ABT9VR20_9BACI|nr:DNA polymerase III subunit delta' [Bacillus alveayuensis]MDQ0163435.1 DNA polymerase-3 subunit delta' [Bacillus alveayuensis]
MISWKQLEKYQPRVLKTLQNTIQKNRLAHAYLFEGKRGTGKKGTALLLARSYFCENLLDGYQPCEQCKNCKRIRSGNHPDVHIVEPDGLSIKKWQIQALQEEFAKTGVESNRKLYIISHCDKMTANAANSLLKFLEEPTKGTMAILLTEQIQQILRTILSRCQILSFQPLSPKAIQEELEKKGVPSHIAALASHLTNHVEEAQRLCEDTWFAEARTLVIKLYEILNSRQNKALLYIHNQWMPFFDHKEKLENGLDLLLFLYKDLISIQTGLENNVIYRDLLSMLKQHALQLSQRAVLNHVVSIMEAKKRLNANVHPQLLMEQLVLTLQEG